jgi:hypothetical protein
MLLRAPRVTEVKITFGFMLWPLYLISRTLVVVLAKRRTLPLMENAVRFPRKSPESLKQYTLLRAFIYGTFQHSNVTKQLMYLVRDSGFRRDIDENCALLGYYAA